MKLVIMKTNKTLKRYKFSKTKRKGNKKENIRFGNLKACGQVVTDLIFLTAD